jgi:hypothetical protein
MLKSRMIKTNQPPQNPGRFMSLQKPMSAHKTDAAPTAELKLAMNPTGSGEASFGKFQKAKGA